MSAINLNPHVACPTWQSVVLDRLPWVTDQMQCSVCGVKMVYVRQLGCGILDEITCSTCAAGPRIGNHNHGL